MGSRERSSHMLRCYLCHYKAIDCEFHQRGQCFREHLCAYRHADTGTLQHMTAFDGHRLDVYFSEQDRGHHFLDITDLRILSAVSQSHNILVRNIAKMIS